MIKRSIFVVVLLSMFIPTITSCTTTSATQTTMSIHKHNHITKTGGYKFIITELADCEDTEATNL